MTRYLLRHGQTIATVLAEECYISTAEEAILRGRDELEKYLALDPRFGETLDPISVLPEAPRLVRHMAAAAKRFGVGPMACVAGALAEKALRAMVREGASHALVDNGGDIALWIDRPVTVGVYAGPSVVPGFGLRFEPGYGMFGVCTSSGSVGHSTSFGVTDAAVVIARSATMADAGATAVGNAVKCTQADHLRQVLPRFDVRGVIGILVVAGDQVAMLGEVPPLIAARVDVSRISAWPPVPDWE